MGVDATWGAFPSLSRNVPFCPRLSSFVLLEARNGEKSGQRRTNRDKRGHFGTNWETPPVGTYGHSLSFLSLLVWISLVNIKQGISLLKLVFSLSFPGILWVWQGQKILGKFGGFPW